ncbi:hypothetical protein [Gloeobacter kilaueensis]|uniref:Uncharacterized protein n=1 Tax=Gloeobacter kilaueensis (strain ATCC BAA-2537 / CCAP 1431/1 / ULC 316 / JS1) TaxID=1183438 RepID=U5QDT9_GLOK1|nr:hypothetical protein [Gloeobacter kilaueensis]AGY57122.1 hypothetical protein GKIL_0876 [Gloeobacter kilaueensis JS1]
MIAGAPRRGPGRPRKSQPLAAIKAVIGDGVGTLPPLDRRWIGAAAASAALDMSARLLRTWAANPSAYGLTYGVHYRDLAGPASRRASYQFCVEEIRALISRPPCLRDAARGQGGGDVSH